MAVAGPSIHLAVKVLAALDLALFFARNIVLALGKTVFVCFAQPNNNSIIDEDLPNLENNVNSQKSLLTTKVPVVHNVGFNYNDDLIAVSIGATGALIVFAAYICLEIWLAWTLYRAARDKDKSMCTKWLIWRVLLLAALFVGIIAESTSNHCFQIPRLLFVGFRIVTIIGVSEYRRHISRNQYYYNQEQEFSKSPDKVRLEIDFY